MTSQIGKRRDAALEGGTAEYHERRAAIARAAAEVFNEHGFRGTSMAAIAEAMGIDRGSLYYYMSSKEELFDEVVREVSEANVARAEAIKAMEISPPDKLRQLVADLMHSYGENYPLLFIYMRENLAHVAGGRASWAKHMRGLNRRYDRAVIGIVEEGYADGSLRNTGPAKVVAYAIIGMTAWTNRWFVPGKGEFTADEIGSTFADLVIGGLTSTRGAD